MNDVESPTWKSFRMGNFRARESERAVSQISGLTVMVTREMDGESI